MQIRIITDSLYLIFQIPIFLLAPENETALGPNISPSGLAAGSIIFLLIPTY